MSIDNTDDIIDSRDIIDRIEELEADLEALTTEVEEAEEAMETAFDDPMEIAAGVAVIGQGVVRSRASFMAEINAKKKAVEDWKEGDEGEELRSLKALAKEAESESSDWSFGETLIRRSYWVEYVQDMLADCGTIPKDIPWFVEIDWEATAKNIESDYASVDFDGVEYLIRSC